MGMKEILDRIKKLEERKDSPDVVTLIYLIDGEEKKKTMSIHDATDEVMKQSVKALFHNGVDENNKIIGVVDDDDFLQHLIDTEPVENIDDIVET